MRTALPGFVDLQVNGFRGVDFSGPALSADAFARACRDLLARGTAAFLPTMITSTLDTYRRNLPLIADAICRAEFRGRLLGIHLEGPFISAEPGAVGVHDPSLVRPPDARLFDELQDLAGGCVRLLTIAAELPGAADLARHAAARGVAVSLGHQMAGELEIERLTSAGASALTHLGNGVPNVLPRHDNPIWAGLAADGLSAMIIADGHHLPAPVLKAIIRAKGVDNLIAVSDASPLAGMPPGRYRAFGEEVVLEESGRLHDPRRGCLAGSSATLLQCVNHLAEPRFGLSLDDLLAVARRNPLRLLGIVPESIGAEPRVVFDDVSREFGGVDGRMED